MRAISMAALIATALMTSSVSAAELPGIVQKPSVDVYAQPRVDAPKVTTLQRNTAVKITAQEGLWYQLQMPAGTPGYVRVNDVRMAYAGVQGEANLRVLMSGKTGEGRVTETAGVRGIDESDLKSAAFDQAQLNAMIGYRVADTAAAAHAREQGWQATSVAYAGEAKRGKSAGTSAAESAPSKPASEKSAGSVIGSLGREFGSRFGGAAKVIPKSEDELSEEELALGPEIAGRILGARPLWNSARAQQRVNLIGRWVAAQTSRSELPWTFGVIDTPEVNAFAAPGGFILIARGLYLLLSSDSEVAAVLGHEISHCVQRDHYNVIRKQEMATAGKDVALSNISVGNESIAGRFARSYAEKHGATIMLTSLDREAEYHADEAAEIYLARAGMNPLALYAALQKMTTLGSKSASLAQLYKTHPPLDERLDRIDRRGYGALEAYTTRE
jgi:hypothetical protein